MEQKITRKDLESFVHRLIDLPLFVSSARKSQRKHGHGVMKDIIMPYYSKMYRQWEIDGLYHTNLHPGLKFNEYLSMLTEGKFHQAQEYALAWYKELRAP
ncbi:hypothetical protein J4227_06495 [Candidatus Woesearchaeota archaeon]|nr:hypothetical protein [Candidatus Woesearchaeota archaeon]